MLAKRGGVVCAGDTVICFHGHDDLRPLIVQPNQEYHCKDGKFKHNDIIGAKFGTRVRGVSNVKGDYHVPSMLVLQNCADLWTMAVPHRTQIIYATDIAVIIMNLRVRPGSLVAEAGTGSGSLTHSFARAVAPTGQVFTFDFHKLRAMQAKEEFQRHGVGHLVTSGWRDVCTTGANPSGGDAPKEWWAPECTTPDSGFGLPQHHVDALFLDVPAPWLAIDNVLHTLKPGGILCTFSPCIEQTQRTCERLRQEPSEFIDIRTVEALTKYFDPVFKRTRLPDDDEAVGLGTEVQEDAQADPQVESTASTAPADAKAPSAATTGDKREKRSYRVSVHFRAAMTSKGHSAYLTFARRRLPRVNNGTDEIQEE